LNITHLSKGITKPVELAFDPARLIGKLSPTLERLEICGLPFANQETANYIQQNLRRLKEFTWKPENTRPATNNALSQIQQAVAAGQKEMDEEEDEI